MCIFLIIFDLVKIDERIIILFVSVIQMSQHIRYCWFAGFVRRFERFFQSLDCTSRIAGHKLGVTQLHNMLRVFLFAQLVLIDFLQSFQRFLEILFSQIIIRQRSICLRKISRIRIFFHKSVQAFFRVLLLKDHADHIAEKRRSFLSGIAEILVVEILFGIFVLRSVVDLGLVEIICQTEMIIFVLCKILRLLRLGNPVKR
ncbi:hypothetical protein D3C86_1091290 [compost metagenome]